jgi:hypothetical protein
VSSPTVDLDALGDAAREAWADDVSAVGAEREPARWRAVAARVLLALQIQMLAGAKLPKAKT